jgi:DNA repair photolyase
MKNRLVVVPSIKTLVTRSPGFEKKELSQFKLDLLALCGFGCGYCSSNSGNYLRINRKPFANLAEEQLGERVYPSEDPALCFVWPDVLERLGRELARRKEGWGGGLTLVFSMLTDAFSPEPLVKGVTRAALELVLARTRFRIRILTKNAVVGTSAWVEFFLAHPGRFVVGLSTGTLDDEWAKRIEVGTSTPTARLRALRALQDAGVPAYGMLCPVFPSILDGTALEGLVAATRPEKCETVWAEPFNDRANWMKVRDGHEAGSPEFEWFNRALACGATGWSSYAVDLYARLRDLAQKAGWLSKLTFLLYESRIARTDAPRRAGLEGLLLQSKPESDGLSRNPWVRALQRGRTGGQRGK